MYDPTPKTPTSEFLQLVQKSYEGSLNTDKPKIVTAALNLAERLHDGARSEDMAWWGGVGIDMQGMGVHSSYVHELNWLTTEDVRFNQVGRICSATLRAFRMIAKGTTPDRIRFDFSRLVLAENKTPDFTSNQTDFSFDELFARMDAQSRLGRLQTLKVTARAAKPAYKNSDHIWRAHMAKLPLVAGMKL